MSIALTFALGTFYYLSNRKWYYKVFVIAFFFFSISNYAIKIPVINQLVVYSQEHEGDMMKITFGFCRLNTTLQNTANVLAQNLLVTECIVLVIQIMAIL